MYQKYKNLKTNTQNYLVYFDQNRRCVKTFSEFIADVDEYIARLYHLKTIKPVQNIAILGATTYKWMVIDHACIKGGFKSIAIPESYSIENITDILNGNKIDVFLCDYNLKDKCSSIGIDCYYFNCKEDNNLDFEKVGLGEITECSISNLIREDYTIVFSSGTSEKVKQITWKFWKIERKTAISDKLKQLLFVIGYKFSFWSRKDNKVIIFMPFSHPINRSIAIRALFQKINIVISDPLNCLKHIITEKPNVMFAVPPVYEAIAQNIKIRVEKFTGFNRTLYRLFNALKINRLGNWHPVKKVFSALLFKKIRKIYGGKADYFVTGSAPTNP